MLVHNPTVGLESEADRRLVGETLMQLRPACEESLFEGVDGDSNLVFADLRNQIRVNLELVEGMAALLKQGLRHSWSALVLARSSFELSITMAWVLQPHLLPDVIKRFMSMLQDEINQQDRIGAIGINEETGPARDLVRYLEQYIYRESEPPPISPLPSMRDRLRALNAERSYVLYGLMSHVAHGSRAAFQPRYDWQEGQGQVRVNHVDEWQGALGITLQGLRYTLYEFAHSVSLERMMWQPPPATDDDAVAIYRGAFERRSTTGLSLLDRAASLIRTEDDPLW